MSPAVRLALIYLAVSCIWILASDAVVRKIAGNDLELFSEIQSIKGVLFVVLCSVLLFVLSRKFYRNLSRSLHQAEEMLHRYKAVSEATKEGIIDHDLRGDFANVNEQMKTFLQERTNHIESYSDFHLSHIHPEDQSRIKRNLRDTLGTGSNYWQADYRFLMHDGVYHDVISRGYIIRDRKNNPLRIISSFQDVTEVRNMRTIFYEQQIRHKLSLSQSIIKAQEEERNRWAEELHDNVCQLLTVVKLYLGQLTVERTSPLLGKAQEMTEKALTDIRQLSATIKPPEFSITTLKQAIEELVANVKRVKTYRFDIDLDGLQEPRLNDDQKLMVYRVVQEQLSNIIKYSAATTVRIHVKTEGNLALLEIQDDGKGFDPEAIRGGIGLKNIQSRLQVFSGNLTIDSAPGKGCLLSAEFTIG